jgi:hypothetical protein
MSTFGASRFRQGQFVSIRREVLASLPVLADTYWIVVQVLGPIVTAKHSAHEELRNFHEDMLDPAFGV